MIARTIQRWWNWLGDWSRWYIHILSPSKMSKEVLFSSLINSSSNDLGFEVTPFGRMLLGHERNSSAVLTQIGAELTTPLAFLQHNQNTLYTSNYYKSILPMLYLYADRLVQERGFSLSRRFSWIRLKIV